MELSIRRNMKAYADDRDTQHSARDRLRCRLWNPWPISVLEIDHDVETEMRVSSNATDFSSYNNKNLQEFSFILYEYQDGWLRYEPCDILRKLLLTSGLEFAWRGTGIQRLVACGLAAAFMALQVHCAPYRERNSNLLKCATDVRLSSTRAGISGTDNARASCVQANILLVVATSMLLHSESMQPMNLGGPVAPSEPFSRDSYGWALLFTTALTFAGCIGECINRIHRMWKVKAGIEARFDDKDVALMLRTDDGFVPDASVHGGRVQAGFAVDS